MTAAEIATRLTRAQSRFMSGKNCTIKWDELKDLESMGCLRDIDNQFINPPFTELGLKVSSILTQEPRQ